MTFAEAARYVHRYCSAAELGEYGRYDRPHLTVVMAQQKWWIDGAGDPIPVEMMSENYAENACNYLLRHEQTLMGQFYARFFPHVPVDLTMIRTPIYEALRARQEALMSARHKERSTPELSPFIEVMLIELDEPLQIECGDRTVTQKYALTEPAEQLYATGRDTPTLERQVRAEVDWEGTDSEPHPGLEGKVSAVILINPETGVILGVPYGQQTCFSATPVRHAPRRRRS